MGAWFLCGPAALSLQIGRGGSPAFAEDPPVAARRVYQQLLIVLVSLLPAASVRVTDLVAQPELSGGGASTARRSITTGAGGGPSSRMMQPPSGPICAPTAQST